MKSGNLNFLETSGPLQAGNGTALPFTFLLTYSTEHSPYGEANRFSAGQEIPPFYGTGMFSTTFTIARHYPDAISVFLCLGRTRLSV